MLHFYTIFHLNLLYSSIEERERPRIIEKCYWPILNLSDSLDVPLGIELSGYTLEEIKRLDPEWVQFFKKLIHAKKVELIGSGYVQLIAPLVPAKVNHWNQKLGIGIYKKILNAKPQIALLNEMAYSAGLLEHYQRFGYQAIVMEWNNPSHFHPEWKREWKYFPQICLGADSMKLPVIWADTISFQKFQRYAQNEMKLDEYLNYLLSQRQISNGYFPLYANDAEIFDYRPHRFQTESKIKVSEWERIHQLFQKLKKTPSFKMVLASEVLKGLKQKRGGNLLTLESAEQPIPVKKQEKYNINRWALTGRDDLRINTKCFQIYESLKKANVAASDWKKLCYFWGSDFRTHITDKRWKKYQRELNLFYLKAKEPAKKEKEFPGIAFPSKEDEIVLENQKIKLILNRNKGMTFVSCCFKELSQESLLGTLFHGYYEDISLTADFFSGHAIIERPGKHKVTDLEEGKIRIFSDVKKENFLVKHFVKNKEVSIQSQIFVRGDKICLKKKIVLSQRDLAMIHPFNFTFIPSSWKKDSLFFATQNGGNQFEKFYLKEHRVSHSEALSPLISAKYGLGATEGKIVIADDKKGLLFKHAQASSMLLGYVTYRPLEEGNYFFRLHYSAQEIDETFVPRKEREVILSQVEITPSNEFKDQQRRRG